MIRRWLTLAAEFLTVLGMFAAVWGAMVVLYGMGF